MSGLEEVTRPGRPLQEYFRKALNKGEVGLASMMLMPNDTSADWGSLSSVHVRALDQALRDRGLGIHCDRNNDGWSVVPVGHIHAYALSDDGEICECGARR